MGGDLCMGNGVVVWECGNVECWDLGADKGSGVMRNEVDGRTDGVGDEMDEGHVVESVGVDVSSGVGVDVV